MNSTGVSLVIPTYNMASDLERLLVSLSRLSNITVIKEVIVVNDGSTDDTSSVIASFSIQHPQLGMREVRLASRVGRYLARLEGAKKAHNENLLFLDTRLELPQNFADHLHKLKQDYKVVQGTVQIKTDESVYSLYWDRSHRKIFQRHFKDQERGFFLNTENFESYTCGMGVFLCQKEIFLQACNEIVGVPLSDDREVILAICKKINIWVTQELSVLWWPRQNLTDFLSRLWERGITFVEYHVFSHHTFLAMPVYLGIVILALNVVSLFYLPSLFLMLLLAEIILIGLSTFWLTWNIREFIKLIPLHVLVVLVFGLSVVRGLVVNTIRILVGRKI